MGSSSRAADLLEEFVPAADVALVAAASKRLFFPLKAAITVCLSGKDRGRKGV